MVMVTDDADGEGDGDSGGAAMARNNGKDDRREGSVEET